MPFDQFTYSITLQDIMTQVRTRADVVNSTFVEDSELIDFINGSYAELWDLITTSYPYDDYIDGYTFSVSAGTSEYAVPHDFAKCVGVDAQYNSKWWSLEKFSFAERNKQFYVDPEMIENVRPRWKYRIWRNLLNIYPTPSNAFTAKLWYVPQPPRLEQLTDRTHDIILNSWIEYVIVDAAIKIRIKSGDEEELPPLVKQKADLVERIIASGKKAFGVAEPEQDTGTSLFNLRIQTRHRSNMLGKPEVISDSELDEYINQSMYGLYDLLITAQPEEFLDGYEFTTGTELKVDMDLPTDFYKMVGLDMEYTNGREAGVTKWYSLQRYNFAERNIYKNATDFIVDGVPRYRYRLLSRSLRLQPYPETEYKMVLHYIPQLTKLSADTDVLDSRLLDAWNEYIITDAASKIAVKTGGDADRLKAARDEIAGRITSGASTRNLDKPEVVQDSEPTLFNLRQQSRYRADMLNSDVVSDTELNHYINNSLTELQDVLINAYGTENFIDGYEFSTVLDQGNYDLPTDFHKLVGVDMEYTNEAGVTKWFSLGKYNFSERNIYENTTDFVVDGTPRYRYRLIHDHMNILPAPESAYNIRLYYIKQAQKLTSDTSKISSSIINGWEEYIIIDTAIKMLTKAKLDVSTLLAQKVAMLERITKSASNRNLDKPEVIQDTGNSLFNLRQQSRYRADMLNSDVVSDTELNHYINNSLTELQDLLIQSYGTENFIDGYEFNTAVDDANYDLPTDFHKLVGVDIYWNSKWYSLDKYNFSERNIYEHATDHIVDGVPRYRYRLIHDHMNILPAPERIYPVRIYYIKQAQKLTSDTSKISSSIIDGWEEYIIIDTAIKMLTKAKLDVSTLLAQKVAMTERIAKSASNRNLDKPEVIQDTGNSLFNLRRQIRYKTNAFDVNVITDTELNHYINNSLGELHDLLIKAYSNDYFLDGYEFNTTAGQEDYDLPTDFYKLGGVDITYSGTTYTLQKYNWVERNNYKNSTFVDYNVSSNMRYRIMSGHIKLLPAPNGSYSVVLHYTPQPETLTYDTDEVHSNIVKSWLEYVIVDVAIKVMIKMGTDTTQLLAQKANLTQRIDTMAENRDWGNNESVAQKCSSNYWWGYY